MITTKPLIGVTPAYDYENGVINCHKDYCEAINKSGGAAIIISGFQDDDILLEIFERCDGFLISGGPDADPKHYGEKTLPFCGTISPYRDYLENFIIKKALECNKPILGICRGMQMLNVAAGGTLYQDIYMQNKDKEILQHSQEAPKWYPIHDIHIEKDSIIWKSFQADTFSVNSFHHQAVKDLAQDFKSTSHSSDGIIESIEHKNHKFAVGVQWHPERMIETNLIYKRIFDEFIRSCLL